MRNNPPASQNSLRPPLEVVGAVFFRQGPGEEHEILAFQRKWDDVGGGKWEFPGGKVESETPAQAIVREIQEEVGVGGRVLKDLGVRRHDYPNRTIELRLFLFEPDSWNFKITDHDALMWVSQNQMKHVDWAGADLPWLDSVFKALRELQKV